MCIFSKHIILKMVFTVFLVPNPCNINDYFASQQYEDNISLLYTVIQENWSLSTTVA